MLPSARSIIMLQRYKSPFLCWYQMLNGIFLYIIWDKRLYIFVWLQFGYGTPCRLNRSLGPCLRQSFMLLWPRAFEFLLRFSLLLFFPARAKAFQQDSNSPAVCCHQITFTLVKAHKTSSQSWNLVLRFPSDLTMIQSVESIFFLLLQPKSHWQWQIRNLPDL